MKKFNVVFKENEQLVEKEIFANKYSEVKTLPGFVAVTKSGNISHPSPEVLQSVLSTYGINIAEAYGRFSVCEKEMKNAEDALIASGDEAAIRREAKRKEIIEKNELNKAENLKKRIADLKKIARGSGEEAEKAKAKLAKLES